MARKRRTAPARGGDRRQYVFETTRSAKEKPPRDDNTQHGDCLGRRCGTQVGTSDSEVAGETETRDSDRHAAHIRISGSYPWEQPGSRSVAEARHPLPRG